LSFVVYGDGCSTRTAAVVEALPRVTAMHGIWLLTSQTRLKMTAEHHPRARRAYSVARTSASASKSRLTWRCRDQLPKMASDSEPDAQLYWALAPKGAVRLRRWRGETSIPTTRLGMPPCHDVLSATCPIMGKITAYTSLSWLGDRSLFPSFPRHFWYAGYKVLVEARCLRLSIGVLRVRRAPCSASQRHLLRTGAFPLRPLLLFLRPLRSHSRHVSSRRTLPFFWARHGT